MKNSYYFSHDFNARNDEKIIELIRIKGWEGYGLYWGLIEKLHEANGYLLLNYDSIAFDMRTQCDCIKDIINNFGLFEIHSTKFTCQRVIKNLEISKIKSDIGRNSANKRWVNNANAMPTQCQPNAIKESKVNKIKEIYIGAFAPPTLIEVQNYCKERNNLVDPNRFINFYESKGWMIGKNKMKDWKAAVRTWENKTFENKQLNNIYINSGAKVPNKNPVLEQMKKWEEEQIKC